MVIVFDDNFEIGCGWILSLTYFVWFGNFANFDAFSKDSYFGSIISNTGLVLEWFRN